MTDANSMVALCQHASTDELPIVSSGINRMIEQTSAEAMHLPLHPDIFRAMVCSSKVCKLESPTSGIASRVAETDIGAMSGVAHAAERFTSMSQSFVTLASPLPPLRNADDSESSSHEVRYWIKEGGEKQFFRRQTEGAWRTCDLNAEHT